MKPKSKFEDRLPFTYAESRQAWRNWLIEHHQTAPGVWLIYYKVKSGNPSIRYPEAVKEALCFGWIDSKVKSIDEARYQQIFTPRRPRSVWSKLNKQYIEELINQGLMVESGQKKIDAAKADGSWDSLNTIEALVYPEDLEQALGKNQALKQKFEALNQSYQKNILFWIDRAKRPETRQKRIEEAIDAVMEGKNPLTRR